MNPLEGANCADLPGFVVDKYFDCDAGHQPLQAMVARAICSRCVVLQLCREQALAMPALPQRGIIGGVTVSEIRRARRLLEYESGQGERDPPVARPEWLERSDAAERAEQMRIEADPDECSSA